MAKTIDIQLNSDSIQKAIDELIAYRDDIKVKQARLMSRLAQEGYNVVISNIPAIYTGELADSIGWDCSPTTAVIFAASPHAMFVEFGTGPKGANGKQYPGTLPAGYTHHVEGGHIGTYRIGGVDRLGWFYRDEYAGKIRFTEGLESRPFMFNSATELRLRKLMLIVREVFGQ